MFSTVMCQTQVSGCPSAVTTQKIGVVALLMKHLAGFPTLMRFT